jgi:hypothetical protein
MRAKELLVLNGTGKKMLQRVAVPTAAKDGGEALLQIVQAKATAKRHPSNMQHAKKLSVYVTWRSETSSISA